MKVLIVDDSKAMQNIIAKAMKSLGYRTDDDEYCYAFDGDAGLHMIRSEKPDIVLCDMHMPKMTGLEMIKALRAEKNATKVIIVSIDDNSKTEASVRAAGGNAYLKKPFTAEQLFKVLTSLIARPTTKNQRSYLDIETAAAPKLIIERVLSSLAGTDVQWPPATLEDIDFACSPFYGCTFQGEKDHVILGIFLDVLAANTIAAIIGRRPLGEALEAAQARRLDAAAKQLLLAFFGMYSGLCKPLPTGQLLDIHAEHFAEDGSTHLSKHLHQLDGALMVYSMRCGPSKGGKIILV